MFMCSRCCLISHRSVHFLPTQSEGLFSGDMNTPNSNFGGLNVKHDELKKGKRMKRNTFHVNVLEWMVSEKTTSSSILKTHKTQKNRKRQRTSSSLWASTRNIINSKRSTAIIPRYWRNMPAPNMMVMLISIITHRIRPELSESTKQNTVGKKGKIKMKKMCNIMLNKNYPTFHFMIPLAFSADRCRLLQTLKSFSQTTQSRWHWEIKLNVTNWKHPLI